MNTIKFIITDTKYIKVTPELIGPNDCEICAKSNIDYVDTEEKIIINFGYDDTSLFCGRFWNTQFIEDLINNKKILNKNITPELGIEWNKYAQDLLNDDVNIAKYYFVSNSDHYKSWLYNDESKNIIFEITPIYPWYAETHNNYIDKNGNLIFEKLSPHLQRKFKKTHPDFITFKQFMKSYKPTLKIIIPKERLIEWNEQAKDYNQDKCTNM